MNSTEYNEPLIHCPIHFTTQVRLNFTAPLIIFLTKERFILSLVLTLCFSFRLTSTCLVFIYIFKPPSLYPTVAKWLHFLDLWSQRESIAWLRISLGRNSHTGLKVLNLIKGTAWFCYAWNAVVYLPWYSWAYSVCSAHSAGSRGHK